MILEKNHKEILNNKNLLGFSGGVDSSAMFFFLLENKIDFDIAIVNYNLREQSKQEVQYAQELAQKYNKNIYIKNINPKDYEKVSSFEKYARNLRYDFFQSIIDEKKYNNLITAHHLNDRLEWTLMQITKGAGLKELYGMKDVEKRKNYNLIRPFFNISREEIENYLKIKNIKFFIDHTNEEEKYKRNYFRKNFVQKLMKDYSEGIKNTFKYLEEDLEQIEVINFSNFIENEKIFISKINEKSNKKSIIRGIDSILKREFNIVMSSKQKEELIKNNFDSVISQKIAVSINKSQQIFLSPYIKEEKFDNNFKDKMRQLGIPPKIRGFYYKLNNNNLKKEQEQNQIEL